MISLNIWCLWLLAKMNTHMDKVVKHEIWRLGFDLFQNYHNDITLCNRSYLLYLKKCLYNLFYRYHSRTLYAVKNHIKWLYIPKKYSMLFMSTIMNKLGLIFLPLFLKIVVCIVDLTCTSMVPPHLRRSVWFIARYPSVNRRYIIMTDQVYTQVQNLR